MSRLSTRAVTSIPPQDGGTGLSWTAATQPDGFPPPARRVAGASAGDVPGIRQHEAPARDLPRSARASGQAAATLVLLLPRVSLRLGLLPRRCPATCHRFAT